ncbi:hypothetical protein L208DRAFT_1293786 [Tricholoma matsutake]|nr:hypothetical protein L208DRAFT_1293786 [Tricholoma matsutake 945]
MIVITHSLLQKMPQFALANSLYHGPLPDFFQDLTWEEEMVCFIYHNTAHVTQLYGSSDPSQPKMCHVNTCAHDMNVVSTASVLPQTPADIHQQTMIFSPANKLKPDQLKSMFTVRKHKVWSFLLWLKGHNCLYAELSFDKAIMDLYPENDILPCLSNRVIKDNTLDPDTVGKF